MPDALFHPLLAAAAEPYATAILLGIFGALAAVSVIFSGVVERLGVPVVLLFLLLGMLGGNEGLGVQFNDFQFTMRIGTMALALILFDGGLNTSIAAIRRVIYPAITLATAGVALTAALLALFARAIGLPWSESVLLAAVVSSTDAAAVLSILRGGRIALQPRLGQTLEVESCINDPMAVILTTTMMQVLSASQPQTWRIILDVPLQLIIGAGIGIIVGYLGRILLRRIHLTTVGLFPALTLALAFISYSAATLVYGSGFLSVYVTAVVLGTSSTLPYQSGLRRVHDALAWLSQIAMFLMLGLLVTPSQLGPIGLPSLAIALFLAFVARPLAVLPCLLPFRYTGKEIAYIGWMGLRGAVPIILATFPVLAAIPGSTQVFNIVFFIVVISSLIPGSTIRSVTRRLKLDIPEKPSPPAILEINSSHRLNGQLVSFYIEPSVAVCGAALKEIEFPEGASILLIIRGQQLLAARGNTTLEAGDHVYIFFRAEDRPLIELLFGRVEEGGSITQA